MLWRCKSTNRQAYAKVKVCMQINMHVCNLTHTHSGTSCDLSYHATKGPGPVVLCHDLSILWGFLCWIKTINSPTNPISYLPWNEAWGEQKDNWVGEASEEGHMHLRGSQLSVTSFLMIGMADGKRYTHMCPAHLRHVSLSPAAPGLCWLASECICRITAR